MPSYLMRDMVSYLIWSLHRVTGEGFQRGPIDILPGVLDGLIQLNCPLTLKLTHLHRRSSMR